MQFEQRQLTRTTRFALREHGLFVSQRDGRGQVDLATEIPYEELLPIRLEYQRAVPSQVLRVLLLVGGYALIDLLQRDHAGRPGLAADDLWLYAGGGAVGLGLLLFYVWHNWWHQAVLHTANLRVALADHPRDRRQLRVFVQNLEARTKDYLRREYAPINPLGLIEPQLRRLAWLHELAVLETPEAQALATRLTGRLPGRGFKSMGQRLEGLYVN